MRIPIIKGRKASATRSLTALSAKARQGERREIKWRGDLLRELRGNLTQHAGEFERVTAQAGDQQRIVVTRQGVDDEIFVRRVVIGTGCAI